MKLSLSGLSNFDFLGVLLLRIGAGVLAAYHGFFIFFGGETALHEIGTVAGIVSLNPSLYQAAGIASATIQVCGGALLVLGLFSRASALFLSVVSGFALANVIIANDYTLTFFAHLHIFLLYFSLVFIGPGRLSLDRKGI